MNSPLQPDPSAISGISKAPFVILPNPDRIFRERAARFEGLAENDRLAPYLRFLAGIARAQHSVAAEAPAPEPIGEERRGRAREAAMPPIDRAGLAGSPSLRETIRRFFEAAEAIEKPDAAAAALKDLRAASEDDLAVMIGDAAADAIPAEHAAHYLYLSAAMQVFAARLAATLEAKALVPVAVGTCPSCGGRPVASLVIGFQGAEGARYAACSLCGTLWNEVRVKCLACGSTKGIGYRAVESEGEGENATVKAEICDNCRSYVKILYQDRNPSLEPVADDVASLGLDMLMKDTAYRRAGLNSFLLGY